MLRDFAQLEEEERLSEKDTTDSIINSLESNGYTVEENRSYSAAHAIDAEHHSDVDPDYDEFMNADLNKIDTTENITEYKVGNSNGDEAMMLVEEQSGFPKDIYFEEIDPEMEDTKGYMEA